MKLSIQALRATTSRLILGASMLGLCADLAAAQTTWYVDDDAPNDPGPSNPFISDPLANGSIARPYDTLQKAINEAGFADNVLVSPGLYFEVDTLDLSSSDGDGMKSLTIQSTNGPVATVVDFSAAAGLGEPGILVQQGETAATLLEGFTLRNGNAGLAGGDDGGGLRVVAGSPTLRNCVFRDNTGYQGGAVRIDNSNSLFEDCSFFDNLAVHQGGGVYTQNGKPTFRRCHFEGNGANYGGAFLSRTNSGSVVTVEECVFLANQSFVGYAGGLAKFDTGKLVLSRSRFLSNVAVDGGGGALISGPGSVDDCTFNTNTSGSSEGGGLHISNGAIVTVRGSTIVNNVGGGVAEAAAVTFGTLVNCVLWDNSPYELTGFVGVSYSDVMGGYAGASNLDADPLFKNAWGLDGARGTLDDDLSLRHSSPCIDAGNTPAIASPYPLDLLGYPRAVDFPKRADSGVAVVGQSVDLGAFERMPVVINCNRVVNQQTKP